MLLNCNLLESVTVLSCIGTILCMLLTYLSSISLVSGIWFLIYFLVLFVSSVSLSFKFIQWLLRLNKPIKYDFEAYIKDYPYFSVLSRVLPETRKRKASDVREYEYDTNELSVFSTVLEKKLVSSWYIPYISEEIGFPFACKQMLDQMISKIFKVCNKIDAKDVYVDICTILSSHFKEYRKAVKRQEKALKDPIESHYKKSHPISDVTQKYTSADHCANILRVIFKDLIPWELWETPHSELLIRILAKKLDDYMNCTLINPLWLNDKLLSLLKAKKFTKAAVKTHESLLIEDKVPGLNVFNFEMVNKETELLTDTVKNTASMSRVPEADERQVKLEGIVEEAATVTEPMEIRSSPVLRQRRGRQGRNEVKIYDRVIEGSVKTWETDMDLQCISLGQDLLASLDGEMTLSRLWGQEPEAEGSPNPPRGKSPQPLWFGEEDQMDLELTEASPVKESRKETSPKPSDTLLKDLQSTVSQAKTKIGDLQVRNMPIDVHRKHNIDEAAGMMEGLLDFGIAGLRKGLRFTGLSDGSQERSPSHQAKTCDKSPSEVRKIVPEAKEMVTTTLLQKEDSPSIPPLVKQQRVISQDSVPSQPRPILRGDIPGPAISMSDSPEPIYEEAADLSTSIAKLRCLLQQRAQTPRTEDIWWESAEETRGRTQYHHSSKPVESATLADEYDMNMDRNSSPGQTSNNMQRLDKLFHRTVTGVFNSIKTAVGAEGEESALPNASPCPDWVYVYTSIELSVGGAVARLVGSRRAFSHVDAALDSLEQLQIPPEKRETVVEDFDEWCAEYGKRWSATYEVANSVGLMHSHVTHRIATLLFADLAESLIDMWLEDFTTWLREQVFVTFQGMAEKDSKISFSAEKEGEDMADFDIDFTCSAIMKSVPMLLVFGEDTLCSAIKLALSSFNHVDLNKDVAYRLLDLAAIHFKKSASLRNPSFDSN